jgi:hypothetical protein
MIMAMWRGTVLVLADIDAVSNFWNFSRRGKWRELSMTKSEQRSSKE